MVKILLIIVTSLALLNYSHISAATLKCEFGLQTWEILGQIYQCRVSDNAIFNGSRVVIDSVEGEHTNGYTNAMVDAINFLTISNVSFFPSNMEKYFTNMTFINIYNSQLQEVTQQDLQPFPNLVRLDLDHNNIKAIDQDTFKFNPLLKGIWLNNNKISHIDYQTFSELNNLEKLYLSENQCRKSIGDATTRTNVLSSIQQIETGDCSRIEKAVNEAINLESQKLTLKINELKNQSEINENKAIKNIDEKLKIQDENVNRKLSELNIKFNIINEEFKGQVNNVSNEIMRQISQKFNESKNDEKNSEFLTLIERLKANFSEIIENDNSVNEQIDRMTFKMTIIYILFIITLIITVSIALIFIWQKLRMVNADERYIMGRLNDVNNLIDQE